MEYIDPKSPMFHLYWGWIGSLRSSMEKFIQANLDLFIRKISEKMSCRRFFGCGRSTSDGTVTHHTSSFHGNQQFKKDAVVDCEDSVANKWVELSLSRCWKIYQRPLYYDYVEPYHSDGQDVRRNLCLMEQTRAMLSDYEKWVLKRLVVYQDEDW